MNTRSDSLQIYEQDIEQLRGLLANFLINHGLQLATAESCTGGLIAATCTDLAGSSAWLERGFAADFARFVDAGDYNTPQYWPSEAGVWRAQSASAHPQRWRRTAAQRTRASPERL